MCRTRPFHSSFSVIRNFFSNPDRIKPALTFNRSQPLNSGRILSRFGIILIRIIENLNREHYISIADVFVSLQVNDDAVMSLMNIFMGALVLRSRVDESEKDRAESLTVAEIRRNM